jgi:hypothetical protein
VPGRRIAFKMGGGGIITVAVVGLALSAVPLESREASRVAERGGDECIPVTGSASAQRSLQARRDPRLRRLEYVFVDGCTIVYEVGGEWRTVERLALPDASGVRGAAVDLATGILYVSYGGDGGGYGGGKMLAYSLDRHSILWERSYPDGIDSMAVDEKYDRIYMPSGELNESGIWYVLNGANGDEVGKIVGGAGAHNTVVGLSGRRVYLGPRNSAYLVIANAKTDKVIRRVGPLVDGVRPFTINGSETLAFTTATYFLGFQVDSLASGKVLYTDTIPGFDWSRATFGGSAPSHGISLSPNERDLWVLDAPNSFVHEFSLEHLPEHKPGLVASVRLEHPLSGEKEDCAYDCGRDGWLQMSRSGRWLFVGDSGDVIDVRSKRVVAFLPAMRQSRVMLEIDWRRGRPVATSTRVGLGYGRRPRRVRPGRTRCIGAVLSSESCRP